MHNGLGAPAGLLEALVAGRPAPNAAASPNSAPAKAGPVQKLHYTHEAMIDLIIAEPGIYNEELAARFGYSPSWISTVVVSDIFQAQLAKRREELIDPELRLSVKSKFAGLLERSMEILRKKMDVPADKVPDQLAIQVAKMAGQSLGFGVKETKVSVSETHFHLTELGNNLVGLLRDRKAQAAAAGVNGNGLPALEHNSDSTRANFGAGQENADGLQRVRTNAAELRHDAAGGEQGHDAAPPGDDAWASSADRLRRQRGV